MGTWKQSRSRKPLSLEDCQLKLTDAIKKTEKIIMTASDEEKQLQIQAVHALSGLVNRYATLVTKIDLESRIFELEQRVKNNRHYTNGIS